MAETAVVVGAGGISNAWIPPLVEEGVEIRAIVDLNPDAASGQVEKYGLDCAVSTDLAEILRRDRPDFVVDLTVPEAHCAVTCAALEAGIPVIGEKPMAASMAEARLILETSERTGKLCMVSQSRRWNPYHDSIRLAVRNGLAGRVSTVDCDFYIGAHFGGFRDRMRSPLLLDMAIHHFDLARFLTGQDAVAVYAREYNPAGSWYAHGAAAACVFEMSGGAVFSYRGSWCAEGFHTSWNGDWRLCGEHGTILYRQDHAPAAQVVAETGGFHSMMRDAELPEPTVTAQTMQGALREMLEYLRTGRIPQTECHDNIKSLAMVFAALESSRTGRRVVVEV